MHRTKYRVVKVISNRVRTVKVRRMNLSLECGHDQKVNFRYEPSPVPKKIRCLQCEGGF